MDVDAGEEARRDEADTGAEADDCGGVGAGDGFSSTTFLTDVVPFELDMEGNEGDAVGFVFGVDDMLSSPSRCL